VFALRMEASESAGDGQAARRWASRLVSRYPGSAQAARARALLEGPPEKQR
jgi:Tfp pilus assembly protein PilF